MPKKGMFFDEKECEDLSNLMWKIYSEYKYKDQTISEENLAKLHEYSIIFTLDLNT